MWSRKQAIANAPPIETWPTILIENIESSKREKVIAQIAALKLYLSNFPTSEITRLTGIKRDILPRLTRKCLTLAGDGMIFGFRALLPYARVNEYTRRAPQTEKFPEAHGGQAGLLSSLISSTPDIEKHLVSYIKQESKRLEVPEYRMRARDLHRIFIAFLNEIEHPKNEWPFTAKFRGKRSIEKYMRSVLERNFSRSVNTRENDNARAHSHVGTADDPILEFNEPYMAVEIDAYKIESHLTVALQTPEGTETECLLERLWLIAAVERLSTAILAYTMVYRSEVNADDVLKVIREAATGRWTPRVLKLPLKYPPGGGLPNGVLPQAYGAIWTCTLLDGALVHLSRAVHERARKALGFSINWGPVGHFERRPNVEKTFDKIGKEIFKRLPSTTGGGPGRGRATNAEAKALRYRIRAVDAEELLDVTIAQHNILPGSGTSYLGPMGVLRYFFEEKRESFLVRRLPADAFEQARTLALIETATVRGSVKEGRRPYIQLDGAHYTNPVLANAAHLIGQVLTIQIDEEDYRQVRAYLPSGAELGFLKVKGKWALTKHSRRTRKAINQLVSKRVLVLSEFDDPIRAYMRYLAQTPPGQKTEKPTRKQVTKIVQLANESEQAPAILRPPGSEPKKAEKTQPATTGSYSSKILPSESKFFTRVKNKR